MIRSYAVPIEFSFTDSIGSEWASRRRCKDIASQRVLIHMHCGVCLSRPRPLLIFLSLRDTCIRFAFVDALFPASICVSHSSAGPPQCSLVGAPFIRLPATPLERLDETVPFPEAFMSYQRDIFRIFQKYLLNRNVLLSVASEITFSPQETKRARSRASHPHVLGVHCVELVHVRRVEIIGCKCGRKAPNLQGQVGRFFSAS